MLLEGPDGSGKTALAAHAAIQSEFPFAKVSFRQRRPNVSDQLACVRASSTLALAVLVRPARTLQQPFSTALAHTLSSICLQVISPENLVGYMEQPKASNITKTFEDAYKSPLSIVILVRQGWWQDQWQSLHDVLLLLQGAGPWALLVAHVVSGRWAGERGVWAVLVLVAAVRLVMLCCGVLCLCCAG